MKRLRNSAGFIIFALAALAFALPARAGVPNLMTYQGRLQESGVLVTGNRNIKIQICDTLVTACSATGCVDTGLQSVYVNNGVFRTTFSVAGVDFTYSPKFLQVEVGGSIMCPLEEITSSPFARTAGNVSAFNILAGTIGTDVTVMPGSIGTGPLPSVVTINGAAITTGVLGTAVGGVTIEAAAIRNGILGTAVLPGYLVNGTMPPPGVLINGGVIGTGVLGTAVGGVTIDGGAIRVGVLGTGIGGVTIEAGAIRNGILGTAVLPGYLVNGVPPPPGVLINGGVIGTGVLGTAIGGVMIEAGAIRTGVLGTPVIVQPGTLGTGNITNPVNLIGGLVGIGTPSPGALVHLNAAGSNGVHLRGNQATAPTVGTPATCGTGPTAAIGAGSTDMHGKLTITSGTASPGACATTISFNAAYGLAPKAVFLSPASAAATGQPVFVSGTTTTNFTVQWSGAGAAASTVYDWFYFVIE